LEIVICCNQTKERDQNFAQQQSHIYFIIPNRAKSGSVEAFKHGGCSSSETTVTQPEAFDPQFISNREAQAVWQQNDPKNLMHACLQMIFHPVSRMMLRLAVKSLFYRSDQKKRRMRLETRDENRSSGVNGLCKITWTCAAAQRHFMQWTRLSIMQTRWNNS
jgi:hypothetical protein